MSATFTPEEQLQRSISTRKMLTWFIVFAIVMFFAGLTSAYLVSKSSGYWVHFDMPSAFHISTAAVVVSSIFAQMALSAAKNDRRKAIGPLLVITLVLIALVAGLGASVLPARSAVRTPPVAALAAE